MQMPAKRSGVVFTHRAARLGAVALVACALVTACSGSADQGTPAAKIVGQPTTQEAPVSPPAKICSNGAVLNSPYSYDGAAGAFSQESAPKGLPAFGTPNATFPKATSLVVVPAGNNTVAAANGNYQTDNTIFYFEPGVHVIQGVMYTGANSVYIGAYDSQRGEAVITGVNGGTVNSLGGSYLSLSRTGDSNANETWEYLQITNYAASQDNAIMGNENGGGFDDGNIYKYDTIGPNNFGYVNGNSRPSYGESSGGGYGIGMGNNTTIEYSCLIGNAQGAFNGGGVNDVITHDEIRENGLGEYPDTGGPGGSPYSCGCSGGGKLFYSVNAVITDNWVHNNYNAGIWLDFDNTGADISHNYISENWAEGIFYEASYNANISDNTLVGNGWASNGGWPRGVHGGSCFGGVSCTGGYGPITGDGGGFPYATILISSSSGNSNLASIDVPGCVPACTVQSNYRGQLLVQGNVLSNNFGGVMVYTDTNRYPGNIDNDSACSIPLGALDQPNSSTYYQQTKILVTAANANVSGTQVTTTGGTITLCSDYSGKQGNTGQNNVILAPSVGMAVLDLRTGDLVGRVASVQNAHSFTLSSPAPSMTNASLLLSAYGGCGPADYYQGKPNVKSGIPSAYYWDNCVWGARGVNVSGNKFIMHAGAVKGCTTVNLCGYMAAVGFNAGVPTLMEFFDSYPDLIAYAVGGLGNIWSANTYLWPDSADQGHWHFAAGSQGNNVSATQWQAAPYNQDGASSFNS
jgi:parallel beta-helix repeat protein